MNIDAVYVRKNGNGATMSRKDILEIIVDKALNTDIKTPTIEQIKTTLLTDRTILLDVKHDVIKSILFDYIVRETRENKGIYAKALSNKLNVPLKYIKELIDQGRIELINDISLDDLEQEEALIEINQEAIDIKQKENNIRTLQRVVGVEPINIKSNNENHGFHIYGPKK